VRWLGFINIALMTIDFVLSRCCSIVIAGCLLIYFFILRWITSSMFMGVTLGRPKRSADATTFLAERMKHMSDFLVTIRPP
jgi:p-aminobenzoyl-glutamate transporter AbgT